MITLKDRAEFYNHYFKTYSTQAWLQASDRWLWGVWMIGNNYQSKIGYYGEYPPGYLARIMCLFPDVGTHEILHLFSGSLGKGIVGDTFDINPEFNPTYVGDATYLSDKVTKRYRLILADPPYSEEDAAHYGTCLVNRNKVVAQCAEILEPCGYLVWLDQVLPMYRKKELTLIGTIGVIRSTNHRVRMVFIWQKAGSN